jgi:hypothetical protein
LSKRFNQHKPYDPADRTYLKANLRDILKQSFAQNQPICKGRGKPQRAVLREGFEGYRHVCDICLTSIFNCHYFCPGCTIDVCLNCYNNWNDVKNDTGKTACHGGLSYSPHVFTLAKKYSELDVDVVMEISLKKKEN